jgi:hypothetical protein
MPAPQHFSGNATSFMFSISVIEHFLCKQILFWFFFCGSSSILSVQFDELKKSIIFVEHLVTIMLKTINISGL